MNIVNKRNIIIRTLSILSIILVVCFLAFLYFLSKDLPQTFLEFLLYPNISIPVVIIIFSFISTYLIKNFFIRNTRAEIFFFLIYILTLNLDGVRCVAFIIKQLQYPDIYINYLTRIAYFGRILGYFSLLTFSVMTIRTDYKPFSILCSFITMVSLLIVVMMPLSPELGQNNLYYPGQKIFKFFIETIIGITILIFICSSIRERNIEFLYLAISNILIYIGSWSLFFTSNYLIAALGLLSLSAGTIFVSVRIHKLYLWY